jgi:hypothetical protein
VLLPLVGVPKAFSQPAIGVALDRYATIAGATFLDQKCKFFAESLATEFRAHVLLIRISLEIAIGNSNMLALIDSSAKKVIDSEQYSACPKDAEKIVVDALFMARGWSLTIRKATVEGAASAGASPPSEQAR